MDCVSLDFFISLSFESMSGTRTKKDCYYSQKTGLPIYIIPVPGGGKIAIAHTPEVLGAIDRNPTAVAFITLAARVIKKFSGLSREGDRILST